MLDESSRILSGRSDKLLFEHGPELEKKVSICNICDIHVQTLRNYSAYDILFRSTMKCRTGINADEYVAGIFQNDGNKMFDHRNWTKHQDNVIMIITELNVIKRALLINP